MKRDVEQLVGTLEQMLDTAQALLDASKLKCSSLASMNLDLIQQATEQESALTARMQSLNEARRRLVAELTGEKATAADAAHDGALERLMAGLPEVDRARIAALRGRLGSVMKDIQFVNITNSIVSRRSLRHFQELLSLLSGGGVDQRYTRRGMMSREAGPRGLLNRIA
jgi:flagellar biosynthesis/type III secretory pathway chaperone